MRKGRCDGRSARGWPAARSLPASFGTSLAVHALLGVRDRLQPLEREPAAGREADPVGTRLDSRQRTIDRVDDLARRRGQHQVTLAFDVHRVAFAGLLVELGVARIALL